MIARIIGLAALAALSVAAGAPAGAEDRPVVVVGAILDGPSDPGIPDANPAQAALLDQIEAEAVALTRRDHDLRFPPDKRVVADWTTQGIRAAYRRLVEDPDVDVIMTAGVLSTAVLALQESFPKPVVAFFAVDPGTQKVPFDGHGSGVRNFTYLSRPGTIERDIRVFHDLVHFSRLHILLDPVVYEVIPDLDEQTLAWVAPLGVAVTPVPVLTSADEALAKIPADAQAVYVTPLFRLPGPEWRRLIDGLTARGLPTFSLFGRSEVEAGVLAGVAPKANTLQAARFQAIKLRRILSGEDAGTLGVLLPQAEKLVINMDTARAIRWYPNWSILTRAELLNEDLPVETRLTLDEAVREALHANLDLAAESAAVAAGREEVARARARLLPGLDISLTALRIDEDRAAAGLGASPERSARLGATLDQVLYSDAALADLRIQRELQVGREEGLKATSLDVAADAARAFLELLRAQTGLDIQRNNLRLTEANLEIARRRQELGVSGPAEVYRWESQIATDRRRVLDAQAGVDVARASLNRLRHHRLEEALVAVPTSLEAPYLLTSGDRLDPYVDNPWAFEVFRGFMVREALERSPELLTLDAAIRGEERALLASRRAFWAPTLALQGQISDRFEEGGAGQTSPFEDVTLPFLDDFPTRDATDWSVALTATLPLSTGGARRAAARQAHAQLDRLRLDREALVERVDLRTRVALFRAGAEHAAIELSREAAEAARRNYQLVEDTYSQGLVSILELLDAQNAAVLAEQTAANAVFDFLIDLMEVQRAAANFEFFFDDAARDAWFSRLEAFFAEVGGPIGPAGR